MLVNINFFFREVAAISSLANLDQYKVLFPVVHNVEGFAREANMSFIPWSRDIFFEG